MDEKKLAELFRDAVGETPPPTFGTGEVRTASHRAAAKRRNTVVAASALAFALVAGGTVTAVALSGGIADTTAANAPASGSGGPRTGGTMYGEEPPAPAEGPSVLRNESTQQDNRSTAPKQGGQSTGNAGTAGSTPSGCQADRELAAALAGELPAAPGKAEVGVPFSCPPGSRGVAFTVTDGSKAGVVSAVLLPKGTQIYAPLGIEVAGTANAQSEAASGAALHIVSQPDPNVQPADAPFTESIDKIAADLAPRF